MTTDHQFDSTVLRHTTFGDVEVGHHLDSRRDCEREVTWRWNHFVEHAFRFNPDAELVFKWLEVNVRCVVFDRQQQHHVKQLADGSRIGECFRVGDIELFVVQQTRGGLELFIFGQFSDQFLDAFSFAVVVLRDRFVDVRFGRDQDLDLVTEERPQLVLDVQVLRVTSRDGQRVAFELNRHATIQLGHRFADLLHHLWFQLRVFQRNRLHPHLLGERLNELLVRDQLHVLGDFPEQRTRLLLLFVEHNLQLIIGEETEVNEDLSDATWGHG